MKWFTFLVSSTLTVALLSGSTGCKGEKKTAEGSKGEKLSVTAPADASMKQGESATINVSITREKFNDPVVLTFTGLPEGVTIMEEDRTIAKDATSAKLTLKAAADAKMMDDHKVTITAAGGTLKQDVTFKVSVKQGAAAAAVEKKLTLKATKTASMKQDETATINVDITRDKFNDPVKLEFKGLPAGVTIMENDWTIAKDVNTAKLTLKAAADAKPVEDQVVTVTGTGGGLTQNAEIKISVKKKA